MIVSLVAHGSWRRLKAHDSRPKARGSRLLAHGQDTIRCGVPLRLSRPIFSWLRAMSLGPRVSRHEPWAMNHQPSIIEEWNNELLLKKEGGANPVQISRISILRSLEEIDRSGKSKENPLDGSQSFLSVHVFLILRVCSFMVVKSSSKTKNDGWKDGTCNCFWTF